MKLKIVSLSRLTRWQVFQLLTDVLQYLLLLPAEILELLKVHKEKLQTSLKALDELLAQERKVTPKALFEAEEGRDYGIRKLWNLVREYSDYEMDKTKETAAKKLLDVFNRYGRGYEIAEMPQDDESAALDNLLRDMLSEAYLPHVTSVGLLDLVNYTKGHNDVFVGNQQTRTTSESKRINGEARAARLQAETDFRALCEQINALALINGSAPYDETIAKMNTAMDNYVDTARQRRKNKNKKPADKK